MRNLSDAKLVAHSLKGTREALGELIRRHQAWKFTTARAVVGLIVGCEGRRGYEVGQVH